MKVTIILIIILLSNNIYSKISGEQLNYYLNSNFLDVHQKENFTYKETDSIETFFPLIVGNKYQYFGQYSHSNGYKYWLDHNEIIKDTLVDEKKYYIFSNNPDILYRYGENNNIIFWRGSNGEGLFCDFNQPNGTQFSQYNPLQNNYVSMIISFKTTNIFGKILKTAEVKTSNSSANKNYAEGLGEISHGYSSGTPGIGYTYSKLINAIIVDTNFNSIFYNEGYLPRVFLIPFDQINVNQYKTYTIQAQHYYNRNNTWLGNISVGIHYVDTVLFEYFKSNDSLGMTFQKIKGTRLGITDEYRFTFKLDTTFFKPGDTLNYRIIVTDRALIPFNQYSPPLGYYKAVVSIPVPVKEDIREFNFILFQNYPNPFNPTTSVVSILN